MSARNILAAAAAFAAVATGAQAASDISGFWVLKTDPASVPRAAATPAAAQKVRELTEARGLDAPAGSPEYARIWCTTEGLPWNTTHSLPIDIRQGQHTVTTTYSVETDPRHIYIDGQKHPDEDVFDFTSVGHSVGRWQGDTLVVSTIGFGDQGVHVIPGGALRSQRSRLSERYRLAGPDTLRVTYTWTDPTTLRRPHTYTLEFERAKGTVWMTEPQCSPIAAMRAKGLPLPPDAPER
jgi:hypothetical protein